MKTLHTKISKDVILFTLICEEGGQPGVGDELCELVVESGFIHEGYMWPFTQPNFRIAG
jgi:hypothetical protein